MVEKICVKSQHVDDNGCTFTELRCKQIFSLFSMSFFLKGKWILQQCLSKNIAKYNSNLFENVQTASLSCLISYLTFYDGCCKFCPNAHFFPPQNLYNYVEICDSIISSATEIIKITFHTKQLHFCICGFWFCIATLSYWK